MELNLSDPNCLYLQTFARSTANPMIDKRKSRLFVQVTLSSSSRIYIKVNEVFPSIN